MNLPKVLLVLLAATPFMATSVLSQTPASSSTEQPPSASRENASSTLPPGTAIPVALSKSMDAKKAKPGDPIEARTTMDLLSHGQIVVPRDTKVMGHVTVAKARSKESPESNLGIAFDRISMKDGRDLLMHASVQAIGRPLNEIPVPGKERIGKTPMDVPDDAPVWARSTMGTSSRPGGTVNPAGGPPDPARTAPDPAPSARSEESEPALDPHTHGVVGLKGLSLSSSDQGSLITSSSGNVHLDGGTQLILRTE